MNRVHSAKQDEEHLTDGEPDPLIWMRDNGYPTNHVAKHPVVSKKLDDDNSGYVVHEITTYSEPPEIADAVEDSITVYVCHCWDFIRRQTPDNFKDHTPAEIGACKHVESIEKSLNALNDESQTQLGGVSD